VPKSCLIAEIFFSDSNNDSNSSLLIFDILLNL
jgi:hypothetical protein